MCDQLGRYSFISVVLLCKRNLTVAWSAVFSSLAVGRQGRRQVDGWWRQAGVHSCCCVRSPFARLVYKTFSAGRRVNRIQVRVSTLPTCPSSPPSRWTGRVWYCYIQSLVFLMKMAWCFEIFPSRIKIAEWKTKQLWLFSCTIDVINVCFKLQLWSIYVRANNWALLTRMALRAVTVGWLIRGLTKYTYYVYFVFNTIYM